MSSPLAAHIEGYTQTVLTRRSYSNWPHEAGSCRVNPKTPEDLHQSRTTPRTSQFEPAIALLVGGTLRSKALPISVLIDSNTDTKIMRGYSEFCVLGDAVKSPTHGPIDRRSPDCSSGSRLVFKSLFFFGMFKICSWRRLFKILHFRFGANFTYTSLLCSMYFLSFLYSRTYTYRK